MLFSMFVSLPTGQVSGKRTVSDFFRIGSALAVQAVPAAKRCFRFHQRTFIVYHSLKALSTTFLFFYRMFTGALRSRASAFIYYQLDYRLSTTFLRFFYFFPPFPFLPPIPPLKVVSLVRKGEDCRSCTDRYACGTGKKKQL